MAIWERLLWPLLWVATALSVAKDCSNNFKVGIEGKEVALTPSFTGNLTKISWKKEGNIVADSRFTVGRENQRISLNISSGCLLLKNLSQHDSGNYTAKVFINTEIKETNFELKILVPPDINCTVNNDTIQLNCTSATRDLSLFYYWQNSRYEEISHGNQSVVQLQRNSDHFQEITCYVKACSSNASKSIKLSDCISEEPDHPSRKRIYSILIGTLMPILIGVLFFCFLKVKNPGKKKEDETLNKPESGAKSVKKNYEEVISEMPEESRPELESMEERKREGEGEKLLSLNLEKSQD